MLGEPKLDFNLILKEGMLVIELFCKGYLTLGLAILFTPLEAEPPDPWSMLL